MSGYVPFRAAFAVAAVWLIAPALAHAAPVAVSTTLTAVNGEGSYDETIGCPSGDGSSWRTQFSGVAADTSRLKGTWSATTEIHRAAASQKAFAQDDGGRIRITTPDRGSADLTLAGGSCASAALNVSPDASDPTISGSLGFTVQGGTGALRGVTGSGTAALNAIGVGPGADNVADIKLNGALSALAPTPSVGQPTASYIGIIDWLTGRATVKIPITNPGPAASTGDAFDVQLSAASVSPTGQLLGPPITITIGIAGPVSGPPIALGRLDNGADAAVATVEIANTFGGATYQLTTTVKSKDALDGAAPTVTQTRSFKTPVLPEALLLPIAPIV